MVHRVISITQFLQVTGKLLRVTKFQRLDLVAFRQKRVQKINEQISIRLFTEQSLESKVGVGIDVF